jgi:lipid II:glycine glycyltransferase (peptidoglycan interpeptide bridge formation enzyme)
MASPTPDAATDDDWDAFLAQHPDGHHEQSSAHGHSRKAWGFRTDRVVLRDGGRIVAGCQVLARRSPVGKMAILKRGPLALDDDPQLLAQVVRELDRLAGRSYASVRVDTFPTQLAARNALEGAGFRPTEQWSEDPETRLVSLAHDDATLLARMNPKARTAARGVQRAGVTIAVGPEGLNQFFDLHCMTASHHGFPTFSRDYFHTVWRVFGSVGRAQLFMAHHQGQPVAGIFNAVSGRRLYYGWTGTSREPEHHKLKANYLLQLHAMMWGRDQGCTHYDLSGTSEFKNKLGGDSVICPHPVRKYYGLFRDLRGELTGLAWTNPTLRRAVRSVAHRLYKPMPF